MSLPQSSFSPSLLVSGALLSYLLCWAIRFIAPKVGLVDHPGGRKVHRNPTPLGGGLGIGISVLLTFALATFFITQGIILGRSPSDSPRVESGESSLEEIKQVWVILGLSTLILVMGLADDRSPIDWRLRLGVQFGLGIAFIMTTGTSVTLFPPFDANWIGWVVTVFWIVGLTNSFNFLDNMDGLAAGVGLIVALLFVGAQVSPDPSVPAALTILAGALGGFLIHNSTPARLFMGDAGSNFLGYLLGTLTVAGTFTIDNPGSGFSRFGVLAPLLVMAVPLYDTFSVILIRIREGRSPFQGDRSHFSHRLVDRGFTKGQAVLTIYLVTMSGGLGALLLHRLQEPWTALVVLAQSLSVLGVVATLELTRPKPPETGG